MTYSTPNKRAFVIRGPSRLCERFLTSFEDRQHFSGFAASRAIDAVEFLTQMPTVNEAIEQVSLSHEATSTLPTPYEPQNPRARASLESLHTSGRQNCRADSYRSCNGWAS